MGCRELLVPPGFRSVEKKYSTMAANLELRLRNFAQFIHYFMAFGWYLTRLVSWHYGLHRPVLPEQKNGPRSCTSQVTS